ncbi:MAG: hypothetical protein HUJ66_08960, partial [Oscillospiraceae bacterium]|nr:hypothetical protein [Oscillospiraceae bacterium]
WPQEEIEGFLADAGFDVTLPSLTGSFTTEKDVEYLYVYGADDHKNGKTFESVLLKSLRKGTNAWDIEKAEVVFGADGYSGYTAVYKEEVLGQTLKLSFCTQEKVFRFKMELLCDADYWYWFEKDIADFVEENGFSVDIPSLSGKKIFALDNTAVDVYGTLTVDAGLTPEYTGYLTTEYKELFDEELWDVTYDEQRQYGTACSKERVRNVYGLYVTLRVDFYNDYAHNCFAVEIYPFGDIALSLNTALAEFGHDYEISGFDTKFLDLYGCERLDDGNRMVFDIYMGQYDEAYETIEKCAAELRLTKTSEGEEPGSFEASNADGSITMSCSRFYGVYYGLQIVFTK